ncbi:cytochrome P450 [Streptomyces sp. RB6PN25]|uniref:Cytochrome P450 n=1 Tax=Streptomyces humicola TaxID=2953240 RepID=A0ABT1PSZ9_9ACTN|nr:cytochrome P450 [Streptomyces humicola]MCQ4080799.1 cytochrome P450 [Streptomyces humicola]
MSEQPVEHDFDGYDIFSSDFKDDPHAVWAAMRAGGCPMAYSDKWGTSWMPISYDDIRNVARDGARFTSKAVEVAGPLESAGGLYLPPLTSDPPEHKPHRDILMPYFLPARIAEFEPFIREKARTLAEELAARGSGDVVNDFAQHLTIAVLTKMLGVPPGEQFTDWMIRMIRLGPKDQKVRAQVIEEILNYLGGLLDEREVEPRDDLISYLAQAELDGEPLTRKHKIGAAFLVLIAGADTTWSAISAALWHLAANDEDRRRLVADPSLLDTATEEFLRVYAPVSVARIAKEDIKLHGRSIAVGERVLLAFGAANRDPEVFEDPDEIRIDRARNRHLTFGSGGHRCLGSNLARLELRVTLEEWLRVMPDFRLTDPAGVTWSGGQTRGPERVDFEVAR